mmetsp:Transcript_43596/g.102955  ORF Transcript_43596/g.102955 Transcript_43596/m.102955 type:complete len:217 (-) Transcript_43596:1636-2286(-)
MLLVSWPYACASCKTRLSSSRAVLEEAAVVPRKRTKHTPPLAIACTAACRVSSDMMYVLPAPDFPCTTNAFPSRPVSRNVLAKPSTVIAVGVGWNLRARWAAKRRWLSASSTTGSGLISLASASFRLCMQYFSKHAQNSLRYFLWSSFSGSTPLPGTHGMVHAWSGLRIAFCRSRSSCASWSTSPFCASFMSTKFLALESVRGMPLKPSGPSAKAR